MKQNRWKSKVLWAAIAAQLIAIGQVTGLWAALGVPQGTLSDAAAAVLQLLCVVGALNDPTNAGGW
jgi:uncharacterized membrane protein